LDIASRSTFRRSAVASGLLTPEQLREAEDALRAADPNPAVVTTLTDNQIAAQLIAMGRLNQWQAEQLRAGRSKFNLGPYQVIDSIGQGGMGQVFKAEHTMMGRKVAIKVLPRHKSTKEAIGSFTREIRAQAQLDHENLVRAFDAGHDGNVYFLVTEYVPGTDLRKFVRTRGRLTMQEAATIISQAAAGLAHAHSRGLIHRDVKPGNLLVTTTGHTKVSDLGLAGFLGDEDADDPRTGKVVGTADYLSPEQILSPRSVAAPSDVYALGCTLYYAVTGKVPFPGGTTREKARRHCEEVPLNPKRINPDLSDEFVDLLAAMMEKDCTKRIQTAAAVVERLLPWAAEAVTPTAEEATDDHAGHARQLLPTPLAETQSGFFGDALAGAEDSPSQLSEATDPVAAATQETVPDLGRRSRPASAETADFSLWLVLLVLVPILLAAAVPLVNTLLEFLQ
jgi:eukaryotic-like serine/threonine-protein kinase